MNVVVSKKPIMRFIFIYLQVQVSIPHKFLYRLGRSGIFPDPESGSIFCRIELSPLFRSPLIQRFFLSSHNVKIGHGRHHLLVDPKLGESADRYLPLFRFS